MKRRKKVVKGDVKRWAVMQSTHTASGKRVTIERIWTVDATTEAEALAIARATVPERIRASIHVVDAPPEGPPVWRTRP